MFHKVCASVEHWTRYDHDSSNIWGGNHSTYHIVFILLPLFNNNSSVGLIEVTLTFISKVTVRGFIYMGNFRARIPKDITLSQMSTRKKCASRKMFLYSGICCVLYRRVRSKGSTSARPVFWSPSLSRTWSTARPRTATTAATAASWTTPSPTSRTTRASTRRSHTRTRESMTSAGQTFTYLLTDSCTASYRLQTVQEHTQTHTKVIKIGPTI